MPFGADRSLEFMAFRLSNSEAPGDSELSVEIFSSTSFTLGGLERKHLNFGVCDCASSFVSDGERILPKAIVAFRLLSRFRLVFSLSKMVKASIRFCLDVHILFLVTIGHVQVNIPHFILWP
nr:hypothetical protein HmN_000739100 [Hymenolepis microstoma]